MPPTKAAKKAAKKKPHKAAKEVARKTAAKAAKKAAKKAAGRDANSDLRRAYEHLGRIEILDGLLGSSSPGPLTAVVELARQELTSGTDASAAELLRAAEHLSFAALEAADAPAEVSAALEAAIDAEFERLLGHAEDHAGGRRSAGSSGGASTADMLQELVPALIEQARTAYAIRGFRVALELARASEALARIDLRVLARIAGGSARRPLA